MKAFRVIMMGVLLFGMSVLAYSQDAGSVRSKKSPSSTEAGAGLFDLNCRRCHPNGDNLIMPNLPLRGSSKLSDFKTFLSFIRDPEMPDGSEGVMPVFSRKQISDQQARVLYEYIVSAENTELLGRSHSMG